MKTYYILDDSGRAIGSNRLKHWVNPPENAIEYTDGNDHLGANWNGSEFDSIAPKAQPPEYTGVQFYEAIGDQVAIEMMLSTDVGVRLIEKKFNAAIASGDLIRSDHPESIKAFAYLVAESSVPSFDDNLSKKLTSQVIA